MKENLKEIAREISQLKKQLNKSAGLKWDSEETELRKSDIEKNGWKIVGGDGLTSRWLDIVVAKGEIKVAFEAYFSYGPTDGEAEVVVTNGRDQILKRKSKTMDVNYIPSFLADIDAHMIMVLSPDWSPRKGLLY